VVGISDSHFWKHYKDMVVGTIHVQINIEEADQQKILSQVLTIFKKKGVKNVTVEITRQ
jgi:Co/Zn/Cd efflux system component